MVDIGTGSDVAASHGWPGIDKKGKKKVVGSLGDKILDKFDIAKWHEYHISAKAFSRPMNRVVHAHIRSLMPEKPGPDEPVFLGGSARPSVRFQELREIAGIRPRTNFETAQHEPWLLKDLRKSRLRWD